MHLDQPVYCDLGVDGRRIEALVAEELLDVADVGPTLQHVGRTGVPQEVAGTATGEARQAHPAGDQVREDVRAKRLAVARQEERGHAGVGAQVRAGF